MEKITICLHCGCNYTIVNNQIKALEGLNEKYEVYWNNRIDRYPFAYSSYSKLINHSILTSLTDTIILINDRVFPTVNEVEKIINHLKNGFACSMLYNVGFMGLTKQLINRIGWWDERYLNGGWEDRDWVIRLKEANLSIYESQESTYDYSWKSPLQVDDKCAKSKIHFADKWLFLQNGVIRKLEEEQYYYKLIHSDISYNWNTWNNSVLNIDYDKPGSGISGSSLIKNKRINGVEL